MATLGHHIATGCSTVPQWTVGGERHTFTAGRPPLRLDATVDRNRNRIAKKMQSGFGFGFSDRNGGIFDR